MIISSPFVPAEGGLVIRNALAMLVLTIGALAVCARADTAQMNTQVQTSAVSELRARAERGDAEAEFKLGRMYAKGDGLPRRGTQRRRTAWE